MNHFKDNLMQQKSYMNWQVAFCLAVFITLMCVLPLFSPLYLKMMGGETFGFVDTVPKYVSLFYSSGNYFILTFLLFIFSFQILKGIYTTARRNGYLIVGVFLITLLFSFLQLLLYACLFIPENVWSFSSRLSFVFFRLPVISPSQRSFRVVCSKPEANMVGIGRARSFPASSAMLGTCLSTRTLRSRTTETLNTTGFPFVCSPINK